MEWNDSLKTMLKEQAKSLKAGDRRRFMARIVKELGYGGQRLVEQELGWNRQTIRKGTHELESGITCVDAFSLRGRKRAEELLPNLLMDLQAIVDGQSQTDPKFQTNRLYTRLSAKEIRNQLIVQKGYTEESLPTAGTIALKLNGLGYYLQKVKKTQPRKKHKETDAIFDQLTQLHAQIDQEGTTLRISVDAKATVKVGPFSRKGRSRIDVRAADHDFDSTASVTPVGILLPKQGNLSVYCVTSKVTSDCLVDVIEHWWEEVKGEHPKITTLVVNLDNGPECHSRRSQFLYRMAQFSHTSGLKITLAYYPPYHSKYNPVERCWGILENHWNGSLLDSVEAVVNFVKSMTWKGMNPTVHLVTAIYENGVKLTEKAMNQLETQVQRLAPLRKWFVTLSCLQPVVLDAL